MISDGFSVWSFILSRLASSSITKKVPEPTFMTIGAKVYDELQDFEYSPFQTRFLHVIHQPSKVSFIR
jgi:hypothetical protein